MQKIKICIITSRNIFDSPNLAKYREIIKEKYDIMYWDHVGMEESCGAEHYFKFEGIMPVGASPCKKIDQYIKYIRYLRKFVRNSDYEKYIIYPNQVAWFLWRELKTKLKGKYLLDIRDHVWSDKLIPGKLMASAVNNSGLCSLTSASYARYLPKHEYVISHNIQMIDDNLIKEYRLREKHTFPIVISFIGTIRFIPEQKKIIQALGNDNRFLLKFIGRGSEQLEEFSKGFNNVQLIGQFDSKELGKFYLDTDFALNMYGNNQITLQLALSNKLYSAAMMGMPILCSPNTYMADISSKYGFGLPIDLDDPKCKNQVLEFYNSLDHNKMINGCDEFLSTVYIEEKDYREKVEQFLVQ